MSDDHREVAIDAIKKKLVGKSLSYHEIFAIMDEIANKKLGPVLTTYFTAAGFKEGFSDEELFHLDESHGGHRTAASFKGIVADKTFDGRRCRHTDYHDCRPHYRRCGISDTQNIIARHHLTRRNR